jgi:hypothetical protein
MEYPAELRQAARSSTTLPPASAQRFSLIFFGSMYFTQGGTLSGYYTTAHSYFGQPSGGFLFVRDFFIAACQLPLILRRSGFGPGVAGLLGGVLSFGIFITLNLQSDRCGDVRRNRGEIARLLCRLLLKTCNPFLDYSNSIN